MVGAVSGLVLRYVGPPISVLLAATACAPYLMLGAPAAAVLLVQDRNRIAAVAAAATAALCLVTQLPLFVSQSAPPGDTDLTLMTANLRLGLASSASVIRQVMSHHVDVLAAEELTGAEVQRLDAGGLSKLLPYSALDARGGAAGTGVWSRYPIARIDMSGDFTFAVVAVRVAMPVAGANPIVVAAHLAGPWPQGSGSWSRDMAAIGKVLGALRQQYPGNSIVAAGDFNATIDTPEYRHLLVHGYQDAAAQSGSGYTPTYPGDTWFGPLIAIDHVITRNTVATNARTISIRGSDHRALVVRVSMKTGGPSSLRQTRTSSHGDGRR
jgi:endonuclease/exonuclease/phosphatase (EEP) superfamily protein YafD